ncbi:MAG: DUF3365 domain-containing protein [Alphaproteobacteria bacterium]|nr:DUF3365 domain-containing protein [Alphaproteobacteria bacterium]
MRRTVATAFLLAGCALAGAFRAWPARAETAVVQPADPAQIEAARTSAQELGAALKDALTQALKAQGALGALQVCHEAAPTIASGVSAKSEMQTGRTALRVRNPANAPDDYERAQLEDFLARQANGEDATTLESAAILEINGVKEFRWMKAIPMGEMCMQCHGTAVAPEVLAEINTLYPEDQATGFKPGDIRGAFTVRKVLSSP